MDSEKIKELNKLAPSEQGIFVEAFGISTSIKEPVIYMRWYVGGMTGGGYHEDSYLHPYKAYEGKPNFGILDIVLAELYPNISVLQYKKVEALIIDGGEMSDMEDYYGNCEDYEIQYIILSELESLLKTF